MIDNKTRTMSVLDVDTYGASIFESAPYVRNDAKMSMDINNYNKARRKNLMEHNCFECCYFPRRCDPLKPCKKNR